MVKQHRITRHCLETTPHHQTLFRLPWQRGQFNISLSNLRHSNKYASALLLCLYMNASFTLQIDLSYVFVSDKVTPATKKHIDQWYREQRVCLPLHNN